MQPISVMILKNSITYVINIKEVNIFQYYMCLCKFLYSLYKHSNVSMQCGISLMGLREFFQNSVVSFITKENIYFIFYLIVL